MCTRCCCCHIFLIGKPLFISTTFLFIIDGNNHGDPAESLVPNRVAAAAAAAEGGLRMVDGLDQPGHVASRTAHRRQSGTAAEAFVMEILARLLWFGACRTVKRRARQCHVTNSLLLQFRTALVKRHVACSPVRVSVTLCGYGRAHMLILPSTVPDDSSVMLMPFLRRCVRTHHFETRVVHYTGRILLVLRNLYSYLKQNRFYKKFIS
ncbi:hypothetical protein BDA96_02G131500 [Sorghum bicolor]|uniref:Uncharacterized protein n=1 Tax=Sorghum bicolor TaxID=4558 RepID=A0A921UV23_SORBI|nr:hypothetical protein BDA96_02G131500 [Sorghum bicolor]